MNTNSLLKRVAQSLLLGTSLFYSTSCEDNENITNPLLLSVQVSAETIYPESALYVVASDNSGKILGYFKAERDKAFEITSDSYTEKFFNLTIVETFGSTSSDYHGLKASSFVGIERGKRLSLKTGSRYYGTGISGSFYLTAVDFEESPSISYSIASNKDVSNLQNQQNETAFLYSRNASRLFITKYNMGVPSSFLFTPTAYAVRNTYTISLNGTYENFQTETVDAPEGSVGVYVYGRPFADNQLEQYLVSSTRKYSGNQLNLLIPGNAFSAYASKSWWSTEDAFYHNFNSSKRSDFDFLEIEAALTTMDQMITYSLKGDNGIGKFDFDFSGDPGSYYDWDVYVSTGGPGSFVLPILPIEITSSLANYDHSLWQAEMQVEVMQFENIKSISQYLMKETMGTWLGNTNSKYAFFNLRSNNLGLNSSLISEYETEGSYFNCGNWFEVDYDSWPF